MVSAYGRCFEIHILQLVPWKLTNKETVVHLALLNFIKYYNCLGNNNDYDNLGPIILNPCKSHGNISLNLSAGGNFEASSEKLVSQNASLNFMCLERISDSSHEDRYLQMLLKHINEPTTLLNTINISITPEFQPTHLFFRFTLYLQNSKVLLAVSCTFGERHYFHQGKSTKKGKCCIENFHTIWKKFAKPKLCV